MPCRRRELRSVNWIKLFGVPNALSKDQRVIALGWSMSGIKSSKRWHGRERIVRFAVIGGEGRRGSSPTPSQAAPADTLYSAVRSSRLACQDCKLNSSASAFENANFLGGSV